MRSISRLILAGAVCLGALCLGSPPALADTPLPTPTNLQAVHVDDISADLWWNRDGLTREDVVERRVNGVWREYARGGFFGILELKNLTPGTTYTFRVYGLPFEGLGNTPSARSAPVTFTTLPGPDTVPPSTPSTPLFSSVTTVSAQVFWAEATDNVEVTGYYLQQLVGGAWTTIRTVGFGDRVQTVSGLTPATSYSFAVIAFDARGNASPRSEPVTFSTLATTATPTCRLQVITFKPGFTASVSVVNTTSAPIDGWTIRFKFPANGVINYTFNGILTRDGDNGTITPPSYLRVIGVGGQPIIGFSGQVTPFVPPSDFTFNGVPCIT